MMKRRSWVTTTSVVPRRLLEAAEDRVDLVAGLGVELAGRLVGQDQDRLLDQRPGDRHPLLLAAGELIGAVIEAIAQADLGQQLDGPLPLLGRHAPGQERDQHVLERRQVADQVERLEDEADLVAAIGVLLRPRTSATRSWPSTMISPEVGRSRAPSR